MILYIFGFFVLSMGLCALAHFVTREDKSTGLLTVEYLVRTAIAAAGGTILAVIIWFLPGWLGQEENALEVMLVAAVVMVPAGGGLMMVVYALEDWIDGIVMFLIYLAVPACVVGVKLMSG